MNEFIYIVHIGDMKPSQYKDLPSRAELIRLSSKTTARLKVAHTCVHEFISSHLLLASDAEPIHRRIVAKAFHSWFEGHYYEGCVSSQMLAKTMKKLGIQTDLTGAYWLGVTLTVPNA